MMAHSGACLEARAAFVPPPPKSVAMMPRARALAFALVGEVTGFCRDDLLSRRKPRDLVHARWLFILAFRLPLPRRTCIVSLPEVGRALGLDPSTVLHGAQSALAHLKDDSRRALDFQCLWAEFQGKWQVAHD